MTTSTITRKTSKSATIAAAGAVDNMIAMIAADMIPDAAPAAAIETPAAPPAAAPTAPAVTAPGDIMIIAPTKAQIKAFDIASRGVDNGDVIAVLTGFNKVAAKIASPLLALREFADRVNRATLATPANFSHCAAWLNTKTGSTKSMTAKGKDDPLYCRSNQAAFLGFEGQCLAWIREAKTDASEKTRQSKVDSLAGVFNIINQVRSLVDSGQIKLK